MNRYHAKTDEKGMATVRNIPRNDRGYVVIKSGYKPSEGKTGATESSDKAEFQVKAVLQPKEKG